ncbi:MAG: hypothetical protein WC216_07430 [Gallionella sp.]
MARDLVTQEDLLLLSCDHLLDEMLIEQMIKFERSEKQALTFWIKTRQ